MKKKITSKGRFSLFPSMEEVEKYIMKTRFKRNLRKGAPSVEYIPHWKVFMITEK